MKNSEKEISKKILKNFRKGQKNNFQKINYKNFQKKNTTWETCDRK